MSLHPTLKVKPPEDYPHEGGAYLRGNDYSPVAVVILLHTRYEAIPGFLQSLAKVAVEPGATLAGFLQTENIGIEKIVCNVVANPNIRYVVLCGVESVGYWLGDAFQCFVRNGVDGRRLIIGSKAPTLYLYNISLEAIERSGGRSH
ncbi:MAG: tetrahydromethanopterin S-methyltransferase subunit A [Candidatus Bathyarchaeia archaeon]|nr:tetrahydromethanopterin S-methyltransferase subunit A [Candidatus Bathyarchaeota archaeon]